MQLVVNKTRLTSLGLNYLRLGARYKVRNDTPKPIRNVAKPVITYFELVTSNPTLPIIAAKPILEMN